jgi:hypothetical protein
MGQYVTKIVNAGLRPFVWVWCKEGAGNQFQHVKEVTAMGFNTLVDVETYNMAQVLPYLKQMSTDTGNKSFVICTKPYGWDGNQLYDQLVPLATRIMPMTYIGDYNKTTTDLANFYKALQTKYPGKFVAGLETYQSDANPIAKTRTAMQREIDAVKPYVDGCGFFRYGIGGIGTPPSTPPQIDNSIQNKIQTATGLKWTTFTEFYNLVKKYCIYSYYFDDQKTLAQEVQAIIDSFKGIDNGENCVDYAQLGVKLAREMGYTATVYGIYCTGDGINHAIFQISGKEFANPTWIDLAAAASDGYSIGSHWCNGALTKEPGWIPYE